MAFQYEFAGTQRWQLWFSTPNEAGAFLAMLLPCAWLATDCALRGSRHWATALISACEVVLMYVLAKTYSRGAVAALLVGAAMYHLLPDLAVRFTARNPSHDVTPILPGKKRFVVRCLFLLVLIALTGFQQRLAPRYMAHDPSLLHRFSLWKGALVMIHVSPIVGWTPAGTGWHYRQWIQPLRDPVRVNNMVNGYLEVGVAHGLLVLVLILWPLVTALVFAIRSVLRGDVGQPMMCSRQLPLLAGAATLSVYLTANLSSVLLGCSSLTVLLGGALAAIAVISVHAPGRGPSSVYIALALCFGLAGTLYASGWLLSCSAPRVRLVRNLVRIDNNEKGSHRWNVVAGADRSVLGLDYGRVLRDAISHLGNPVTLTVVPVGGGVPSGRSETAFLFGATVAWANRVDSEQIVLINPVGAFPSRCERISAVVLPHFDELGSNHAWRDWAKRHRLRVIESPAGRNVAPVLSSLLLPWAPKLP